MEGKIIYFIIVAVIFCFYFSIRAIIISYPDEKENRYKWVLTQGIYQFWFNFVCSAIGWFSLYCIYEILKDMNDLSRVSVGCAIILTFLSILGILGITGNLPQIILRTDLKSK